MPSVSTLKRERFLQAHRCILHFYGCCVLGFVSVIVRFMVTVISSEVICPV